MSGPVVPPPMPQASLLSAFTTAPVWSGLQGGGPNHDGDEELVKQAWERSRKAAKDAQELSCELQLLQKREEDLRLATPATDPGLGLAKGQQFLMLPHETLPYLLCEAYRVAKGNDPLSVPNPSEMFELATWCCKGGYADDNKLRELVEGGDLRPASLHPRMLSGWRFPDGGVAVSFTMVSAAERVDAAEVAFVAGSGHRREASVVGLVHRGVRNEQLRGDLGVALDAGDGQRRASWPSCATPSGAEERDARCAEQHRRPLSHQRCRRTRNYHRPASFAPRIPAP